MPRQRRKQTKNLSLDSDAVRRGEEYSKLHGTSLSQIVSDFLARLPLDSDAETKYSPAVRRLIGIGGREIDREDYRRHLLEKYGA